MSNEAGYTARWHLLNGLPVPKGPLAIVDARGLPVAPAPPVMPFAGGRAAVVGQAADCFGDAGVDSESETSSRSRPWSNRT